jgi:hypothetical protein
MCGSGVEGDVFNDRLRWLDGDGALSVEMGEVILLGGRGTIEATTSDGLVGGSDRLGSAISLVIVGAGRLCLEVSAFILEVGFNNRLTALCLYTRPGLVVHASSGGTIKLATVKSLTGRFANRWAS